MQSPSSYAMNPGPTLSPTSGNDQLASGLLQLLSLLGVTSDQMIGQQPQNPQDITRFLLQKLQGAQEPDADEMGMGGMMGGMMPGASPMMGMMSGMSGGMGGRY